MTLVDQVKNSSSGKGYRVTTTDSPPLRVWRTLVWEVGFLGLSKLTPLLILVSPDKETAEGKHKKARVVVEWLPISTWQMPREVIDLITDPSQIGRPEWHEFVEKVGQWFATIAGFVDPAQEGAPGLLALANLIVESSLECCEAVWSHIDRQEAKEAGGTWPLVLFEFVYFFMHTANRMIFSKGGPGETKGRQLQTKLGSIVSRQVVDAVAAEFPQKSWKVVVEEFYSGLNQREMAYTECTALVSDHERTMVEVIATGATFRGLVRQVVDYVATVCGSRDNIVTIGLTTDIVDEALNSMRLKELVDAASGES